MWRYLGLFQLLTLSAVHLWGGPQIKPDTERERRDSIESLRQADKVLRTIQKHYAVEVPYRDLIYGSIHGMTRRLDPHTSFLSPQAFKAMASRQAGSFFGVGILVSMRAGRLVVIAPIEGTPASRAGLLTGDVISHVDGEPTERLNLGAAVSLIKGPKDSEVVLTVRRHGLKEPLELRLARDEIPQETVRYAYMMTPNTGYLRLTDFIRSTSQEFTDAMESLRQQGMRRLILDLRSNGGGLLNAVVDVASHFVPRGETIVSTKGRIPKSNQKYVAKSSYPEWDLPLVVLTNHGTASAAEILSGSIQDHDLGLLVGTTTWGKSLVQTVYNLGTGAGMALTTALYFTPAGRQIQRDFSSFYDYYSNSSEGSTPDSSSPPEGDAYRTALGRPVFAAGGISPDVEVNLPAAPDGLAVLYSHNVFMRFAVEYVGIKGRLSSDWRPDPKTLTEFEVWLGRQAIDGELTLDLGKAELAKWVLRQIHADVMNALYGTEAAHRVTAEGDLQIQRALELFDEASKLLQKRRQLMK